MSPRRCRRVAHRVRSHDVRSFSPARGIPLMVQTVYGSKGEGRVSIAKRGLRLRGPRRGPGGKTDNCRRCIRVHPRTSVSRTFLRPEYMLWGSRPRRWMKPADRVKSKSAHDGRSGRRPSGDAVGLQGRCAGDQGVPRPGSAPRPGLAGCETTARRSGRACSARGLPDRHINRRPSPTRHRRSKSAPRLPGRRPPTR